MGGAISTDGYGCVWGGGEGATPEGTSALDWDGVSVEGAKCIGVGGGAGRGRWGEVYGGGVVCEAEVMLVESEEGRGEGADVGGGGGLAARSGEWDG